MQQTLRDAALAVRGLRGSQQRDRDAVRDIGLLQRWPFAASEDRNRYTCAEISRYFLERWPSAAGEDRNSIRK
jgi:hypothetical protein